MKKVAILVIALGFLVASCTDSKQKSLTQSAIHAKVDSMVGARMDEINRQAMEDLDHRIAIEVKAKADSIVAARMHPQDTATHAAPAEQKKPHRFLHN